MGEIIVLGMVLFVSQGASVGGSYKNHMRTFRLHKSRFTTLSSKYHPTCTLFPPLEVIGATLRNAEDAVSDGLSAPSYYEALVPYENTDPILVKLYRYQNGLTTTRLGVDFQEYGNDYENQSITTFVFYYQIVARQFIVFCWAVHQLTTVYKQLWNEDFEVNSVPCAEQLKKRIKLSGNLKYSSPCHLSSILEAATILRENRLTKAQANYNFYLRFLCSASTKYRGVSRQVIEKGFAGQFKILYGMQYRKCYRDLAIGEIYGLV